MNAPAPGATAFCGTEPAYYETTSIGRMESMQHISWERCLTDWNRNHPTPHVDRHYDVPVDPATAPGVDDSAQMWLAQHTDLAVAIAVIGIAAIIVILFMLMRRQNQSERKA